MESIKADSTSNLLNVPKNATVYELTWDTIRFIERLYEHYNAIADIIQLDAGYVAQLASLTAHRVLSDEDRNKTLFGLYISTFLEIDFRFLVSYINVQFRFYRENTLGIEFDYRIEV